MISTITVLVLWSTQGQYDQLMKCYKQLLVYVKVREAARVVIAVCVRTCRLAIDVNIMIKLVPLACTY